MEFTPDDLDEATIRVAALGDKALAVTQAAIDGEAAELSKLFVDPDWLGHGLGRRLFEWAARTARTAGARRMVIESDPGAAPFYRRQGARDAGQAPSVSIPGRLLPRLVLEL